jgi:hypothetical protein
MSKATTTTESARDKAPRLSSEMDATGPRIASFDDRSTATPRQLGSSPGPCRPVPRHRRHPRGLAHGRLRGQRRGTPRRRGAATESAIRQRADASTGRALQPQPTGRRVERQRLVRAREPYAGAAVRVGWRHGPGRPVWSGRTRLATGRWRRARAPGALRHRRPVLLDQWGRRSPRRHDRHRARGDDRHERHRTRTGLVGPPMAL